MTKQQWDCLVTMLRDLTCHILSESKGGKFCDEIASVEEIICMSAESRAEWRDLLPEDINRKVQIRRRDEHGIPQRKEDERLAQVMRDIAAGNYETGQ